MRIVGLTGRIGTGKSTVAAWLADLGALTLDSDALVAELYERDAPLRARLAARFGQQVIRGQGVDKAALRASLTDAAAVTALEEIVHPAVRALRDRKLLAARGSGVGAAVVEAIKLVESGGSEICDELWIVVAAEPVQLERLARRGVSEEEARRRMAWQGTPATWSDAFLSESSRLGRYRPVILFDNSGTAEHGRAEVTRLWRGVYS